MTNHDTIPTHRLRAFPTPDETWAHLAHLIGAPDTPLPPEGHAANARQYLGLMRDFPGEAPEGCTHDDTTECERVHEAGTAYWVRGLARILATVEMAEDQSADGLLPSQIVPMVERGLVGALRDLRAAGVIYDDLTAP